MEKATKGCRIQEDDHVMFVVEVLKWVHDECSDIKGHIIKVSMSFVCRVCISHLANTAGPMWILVMMQVCCYVDKFRYLVHMLSGERCYCIIATVEE